MTSLNSLKKLEFFTHPDQKYDKVIIILHGLGASGYDFNDFPQLLQLNKKNNLKYIFPHASKRPITINQGMVMPAWYDIKSISFEREIDQKNIDESLKLLEGIILEELKKGLNFKDILIGGFSQGGAMSFELAYCLFNQRQESLAGVFILSAYLLNLEKKKKQFNFSNLPILMIHGRNDQVIDFNLAQNHKDFLIEKKIKLTWVEKSGGHSITSKDIKEINYWINQIWL